MKIYETGSQQLSILDQLMYKTDVKIFKFLNLEFYTHLNQSLKVIILICRYKGRVYNSIKLQGNFDSSKYIRNLSYTKFSCKAAGTSSSYMTERRTQPPRCIYHRIHRFTERVKKQKIKCNHLKKTLFRHITSFSINKLCVSHSISGHMHYI